MLHPQDITYIIFLIFTGTAVLSTMALLTRQSLLVAYIALGAILGPWGLKLVTDSLAIRQAGDIGILFLLFLLGLHLQPQNLYASLRKMSVITFASSAIFFIVSFLFCRIFGYTFAESIMMGVIAMFSSTIIGLKLLPTTILHNQHTGGLLVSILLLQDIIAIATLLVLELIGDHTRSLTHLSLVFAGFPALLIIAFIVERFILSPLVEKFKNIQEYIFVLSIGWCLCLSELSHIFGLSDEIGAFIAGVALASNPIAFYIAESLKPLRDFFLIIFFFTIGAGFDFSYFHTVIISALTFAALILITKPLVFNWLLRRSGEIKSISMEVGVRLGQMSEFSLLVVYLGLETRLLEANTAYMMEAAIILTFIVSCYWTTMQYPTPLAASDNLRRD